MFGANAIWGLMSPRRQIRNARRYRYAAGCHRPADRGRHDPVLDPFILPKVRTRTAERPGQTLRCIAAGRGPQPGQLHPGRGHDFARKRLDHHHEHAVVGDDSRRNFPQGTDHREKVLGIAAGASGALLLVLGSGNTDSAGGHSVAGDLLVLFAQLSYALYFVLYKNFVTRYSLTTIMKWMFTFATLCILPFTGRDLLSTDWQALSAAAIGSLAFIVVGSTFLSYMLIIVGQKNLRPTVAGMYNYIQPLVATLVAVCWGMETFDPTKICSVLLIFSGVYLVTTSRSRADAEKSRLQPESPRKRQ